jgi:hypothetical protein
MRRPSRLFVGILVAILSLIATPIIVWQMFWIHERILWPNPSNPLSASGVADFVADHFSFTQKSKQSPNRPPIYIDIDSWLAHPTVVVYTITDRQQQDKILDLVRQYKEQHGVGTIAIKFYREENWNYRTNQYGEGGCSRGPEELLRSEKFK